MRNTILFGGTNKERLVSVASRRRCARRCRTRTSGSGMSPTPCMTVKPAQLLGHKRPFEDEFEPESRGVPLAQALDRAKAEGRVLVLGLHGGRAENGELQTMCEMRGVPFTGSGSASSHLAFDKAAAKRFAAIGGVASPSGIDLGNLDEAFAEYGKLIAKPRQGRVELWPDLCRRETGPRRRPQCGQDRGISDRAVHIGRRGDLRRAGAVGRQDVFAAAGRDRRGRRAGSTTPQNIS